MSDSDDYVNVKIEVYALGPDELTAVGPAELEVTASAGEFDGILIAVTRPDAAEHKHTSVQVSLDGAREVCTALALAIDDAGHTGAEHTVPAISCWDDSQASVEIATDAAAPGIFMSLIEHDLMTKAGVLLVDADVARLVADALQQADGYLVENGYEE